MTPTKKSVRFDAKDAVVHYFPKVPRRDQERVWSVAFQPQVAAEEPRGLERQSLAGSTRYIGHYRAAMETVMIQQAIWQRRMDDDCSKNPMSMAMMENEMQEAIAVAYRQQTVITRMAAARIGERDEQVARLNEYDAMVSKMRSPTRRGRQGRVSRQKPKGLKKVMLQWNTKLQRVCG